MPEDVPDVVDFAEEAADVLGPLPPKLPTHNLANSEPSTGAPTVLPPRYAESESSPQRQSMSEATRSESGYMDKDVKNYLKFHFRGTVYRHYPVHKFISQVWKLDIDELLSGLEDIEITLDHYKAYVDSKWAKVLSADKKELRTEGLAARAFTNLWNHIASQMPVSDAHDGLSFFNMEEKTVIGTFAMYKPDFLSGPWALGQKPDWLTTGDAAEMKKRLLQQKNRDLFMKVAQTRITPQQIRAAYLGKDVVSATIPTSKRKASEFSEEDGDDLPEPSSPTDDRRADPSYSPTPSSKAPKRAKKTHAALDKKMTFVEGDASVWTEPDNGATGSELSGPELQIAKYLNELISHGVRTYATGFLIQDYMMKLWYADRMGLVHTISFDMFREPWFLILVIAAHRYGTSHDFGLNPFVHLQDDTRILKDYNDATIILPSAISATLPPPAASVADKKAFDDGKPTSSGMSFKVELDEGRSINTAYGTVGRGTSVVPAAAVGDATKLCGSGRLVVKLSSPLESRKAEDQLIRVIRRTLNDRGDTSRYLKHIVDLKCSFSCDMDDEILSLPRSRMARSVEPDLRRCFRVLVMPEYLPLERLSTPEELHKIMSDVVTGHHWVFVTSNILHCDVSHGNIMFYYEVVDGVKTVVGVMTDWDLAALLEGDGVMVLDSEAPLPQQESQGSQSVHVSTSQADKKVLKEVELELGADEDPQRARARYRTGTGPFMAVDLLETGAAPRHQYRHDLESFFWVLVWFCAVFNPDTHRVGMIPSWHRRNLVDVGTVKRAFLEQEDYLKQVFAKTHPSFERFTETTIYYLREQFCNVNEESHKAKQRVGRYFGWKAKLGKDRNAKRNMKESLREVIEARKHLRDMITYEHFMAHLGRVVAEDEGSSDEEDDDDDDEALV
ncbi:hypothetical protein EIP91_010682 [Steccherinum ochraceum]|uniref:Fungal-type protein kinase domain-containing protein n=1 Tax=Steccherinum ochraceum TaxID=92696 RepID=A0A4R0RCE0_9APHY|nr:hypothetical protein EIP91_010682 [Steccherinum ochraceum]